MAKKEEATAQKYPQEQVYTAEQLAEACHIFDVRREIVVVSLRLAGKKTATVTEARTIIDDFKNKEVK